jgi:phosphoribosylaminoimidazolecarboxamide formyltransferase / IMP cyclohydrolase
VTTALLSVYDKTGVTDLATGLHDLGWRLVSSGGTAKAIAAAGLPVTDVADLTGFPAILGHRVVTLHPAVHAGLLADLDQAEHRAELATLGIEPISLLVVNLYPFSSEPGIDLIDVGGPAMIRAAAKNHAHVGVLVDRSQYGPALAELRAGGALAPETRRDLARVAFERTAAYDAEIAQWLARTGEDRGAPEPTLPGTLELTLERAQELRYGENPHQQAARYRLAGRRSWWDDAAQLGGKELSYLNLYDTEAAWKLVHRFEEPAVVIVKHANPCGVAVASDITSAYIAANAGDPVSAFGGIVAANRPVPRALAEALVPVFTEVVVAPSFDDDALAVLATKKNLRVLAAPAPHGAELDLRSIDGGLLAQEVDRIDLDRSRWRVVTTAAPDEEGWADLSFAWQVCAAVSSNAIVLTRDRQALGIGAGQQNRVDSARIAVAKAAGRAVGGSCASDAFFPFRDGLDAVAEAGIAAVIQPGGSVRDDEVVAAADEHGIAMVFTGERHFRH